MMQLKSVFSLALLLGTNCAQPFSGTYGRFGRSTGQCWPPSPPANPTWHAELARFEPWFGKWVSECVMSAPSQRLHGSATFSAELSDDQNFVVERGHLQMAEQSADFVSYFYWDHAKERMVFRGCTTLNESWEGTAVFSEDGATLTMQGKGVTPNGEPLHGVYSARLVDPNTAQTSSRFYVSGQEITSICTIHRLSNDSSNSKLKNRTDSPSIRSRVVKSDCLLGSLRRVEETKTSTLAVFDFDVGEQVTPDAGKATADLCRDLLQRNSLFILLDRERMATVLGEQDFVAAVRCDNSKCLVKYGKLLGAARIMHGRINKLGKSLVLTVAVTNTNTGQQSSRSSTLDEIEEAINVLPVMVCEVVSDATRGGSKNSIP